MPFSKILTELISAYGCESLHRDPDGHDREYRVHLCGNDRECALLHHVCADVCVREDGHGCAHENAREHVWFRPRGYVHEHECDHAYGRGHDCARVFLP